jgi:hypothetical protein
VNAQPSELADLDHPVAQELLTSRLPAQLAYSWADGTPRVVPIWFHWTGKAVVFGTPPRAPKLRALSPDSPVAVSIDDATAFPYKALLMRGTATTEMLDDVFGEYATAAHRYMGPEQGEAWVAQLRGQPMSRITFEPTWARVLDFVTRFPSALSA